MQRKLIRLLPILTVIATLSASADNVRGPVTFIASLPLPGEQEIDQTLKPGEIGAIGYPDDATFVEGVEIEVIVPEAIRNAPGSFAIYIYRSVKPPPEQRLMSFAATRVMLQPIPPGNRLFLLVPIRTPNDIHAGPGAVVAAAVVDKSSFPLLVSFQPIAKGIPPQAMTAEFRIFVRPIAGSKGGAHIVVSEAETGKSIVWAASDSPIVVTLNGDPLPYQSDRYLLDPGLYRIEIDSTAYNSETRTFEVDKGRTTEVSIPLDRPSAFARFAAPRGATVFVDGTQITSFERVRLSPGEHTVVYRLGDYTVSRRFTAEQKKDYEISLFLDIMINETK